METFIVNTIEFLGLPGITLLTGGLLMGGAMLWDELWP